MTIDRTSSSKSEEEVLVGIAKGNFNTQKYPNCLKGICPINSEEKFEWLLAGRTTM